MSRTVKQIEEILQGSRRWNAGLQWYDFLLAKGEGPPGKPLLDYYGWVKKE